MHSHITRFILRTATLGIALFLVGTALAATKSTSSTTKADCYSSAALQFSIDNAQCSGYPPGSEAANYCLASAAQKYSLAIVGCEQAATTHWGAATGIARPKLQAALATRLP